MRKVCGLILALSLCGCGGENRNGYLVVTGKDKKFMSSPEGTHESYIISVKAGDFPMNYDFQVTLG